LQQNILGDFLGQAILKMFYINRTEKIPKDSAPKNKKI
jgi:hypothetical protein